MGVNALNRSVVNLIPRGEFFGFDMLLLKLLDQKIPVRCYRSPDAGSTLAVRTTTTGCASSFRKTGRLSSDGA